MEPVDALFGVSKLDDVAMERAILLQFESCKKMICVRCVVCMCVIWQTVIAVVKNGD